MMREAGIDTERFSGSAREVRAAIQQAKRNAASASGSATTTS